MHPLLAHGLARIKQFALRFRVALITVVAAIALFGLIGIAWLPGYAKKQAEALLSETIGRPVTIGAVSISPYQLKATVHNLVIDPSAPALRIKALSVNLSSLSLAYRAPVIQELVIDHPEIQIGRDLKGRLSIADIIEKFAKAPPAKEPVRFALYNIQVINGSIRFIDAPKKQTHTISELTVGVPVVTNFSNKEEIWIEPKIAAKVDGAPFQLNGKTHIFGNTKEAFLDIDIKAFPLEGLERYADMVSGLAIRSGKLDSNLKLSFVQKPDAPSAIKLSGNLGVQQLSTNFQPTGTKWLVQTQNLSAQLSGISIALPEPLENGRIEKLQISSEADSPLFSLKDQSLPEVAPFSVTNAAIALENLDLSGKTPTRADIGATVNQRGRIKLTGNVQDFSNPANTLVDLAIDAKSIDLIAFQRFAKELLHSALFTRGAASFNGTVKGKITALSVQGDATLSDFNVLDRVSSAEIARWKSVRLQSIALKTNPLNISIPLVTIDDLFNRLTILPDGRFNFIAITQDEPAALAAGAETKPSETAAASGAPATAVAPAVAVAPVSAPPSPASTTASPSVISIGKVALNNTSVLFNDQFTKPNFRASLSGLTGTIGPLKTGVPGPVNVQGFIDRTAPLSIQGTLDPFGSDLFVDLAVNAKGIEMPPMSPYAIKYLAYPIEKGKLSLDVRYKVEKSQLKAENKIFLDQLTLGEKVDNPDALSVPVSLAVALLKNSRGEIDINLPISGSINDPEFKIGSILFKAFINLIVKAATAPFSLLGSLFGSSADLSQIAFASGSAAIDKESEARLSTIAKSLLDRPALKLEIMGSANAATDTQGAKRVALDRQVWAEKLAALASKGESAGRLRDIEITPQEYPIYLTEVYKKASFKKPRNFIGFTKSLPVNEMEKLLLEQMTIGPVELTALADQRSRAAMGWLVKQGVPSERIFVVASHITDPKDMQTPGRAAFTLR